MNPLSPCNELWAPDDTLRPQASTTCGKGAAEAVPLVLFRKIAPPAKRTGRKIKPPDTVPKNRVFLIVPQIFQIPFKHISNYVALRKPFLAVHKTGMIMKQG